MATGTTITTYTDREYLFRLQTLVIDGGTEVIRNIFDQSLQNQPLNVVLAREKTNVNRLRGQKTITQQQYDLLYPPCGQSPPTSSNFDISLISCLLRNLPSLGLNRSYKWNNLPQPTDMSVEANLCRLKGFRNKLAHISSTTEFQQASFQTEWSEIEQVLLSLNSTTPNPLPNFNQTIENYKYSPMDPSAEQRIQTIMGQWQNMERGLESEIVQIKEDCKELKRNLEACVDEFKTNIECIKLESEEAKDKAYVKLKSELQDELISFYKRHHKRIHLSPLFDEDQPLLKFYVMPNLKSVKVSRSRGGNKEEKTPVRKLGDMFYKENKLCNNIYLAADAGLGKTAFSKRLALTWCHAKTPDQSDAGHFSEDELTEMRGFSFVFLVLLRDSSNECDIDMLILNQIFPQLSHRYTLENLTDILHEEMCLVILDGLDEWEHPEHSCRQGRSNIPHQRVRENIAVLTTTRPWKLSVSGLYSSQIDHKLELLGLSDYSAKKLKRSVISHLYTEHDEQKIDTYEQDFNFTVHENHKSNLIDSPLFLVYTLFLWYYQFNVGNSLAELYSSFIELLLSRTAEKDRNLVQKTPQNVKSNIPPCFCHYTLCKQFYTVLTSLGELAFQTIFNETKENTLVFDRRIAEEHLNKDELTFFLKTGIISQSKVQGGSLLEKKTKVSFAHKTVQEYLAALYMTSSPNQASVQEMMVSRCKCIKDILDMSKILMFAVGIYPKSSFSQNLMKIINEDEITQVYRSSLGERDELFQNPLKDLQDMYISFCKEIQRENEVNLCLQDAFIFGWIWQQEYRENLKQLTTRSKQYIRSVYIDMYADNDTPYETARNIIDYFALNNLQSIEKIHYKGEYSDDDILPMLTSSVKTLILLCDTWLTGTLSCLLFDKVTSLKKLEAIRISQFKMSHSMLRLFLGYISQRCCMKEIKLEWLYCTDHEDDSCTGLMVDLSQHLSLTKLKLRSIELSKVIVNLWSIEKCCLQNISNQDLELKFINCADNKLNTLNCRGLQSAAAIDAVLHVLRSSRYVRQVELSWMDFGTGTLTFKPDCMHIESLKLWRVNIKASAFCEMVGSVHNLQQNVTVGLQRCTILPCEEFETVKEKIKASQRFRIMKDEMDSGNEFEFEKVKDGD